MTFLLFGNLLARKPSLQAAEAEMALALALEPDLPQARLLRARDAIRRIGEWHVSQERWNKAAATFYCLSRLEPENSQTCQQTAALLLFVGDRERYRRTCEAMLRRNRNTRNPNDAERTAKAGLISPEPHADEAQYAHLAEVAVEQGRATGYLPWFQFARGLAEYRLGRYQQALPWFAQSRAASRDSPEIRALDDLFQAMALIRTGRADEARQILTTTIPAVNSHFGREIGGPTLRNWHDWLFCRLAADEATKLLNDGGKNAKSPAPVPTGK